ncbi:MAG: quinol:cytochrome C oxidoreductase [Flavobacteriia bacterium]|nr:MAG: quinol:cytochrome C oxidoreductase [Flavobacteriia bacterium]
MASNKKYWVSTEELKQDSSLVDNLNHKEFVQEIPTDEFLGDKENLEASSTSRRDFLKYLGFTTAAASLASCEGPVRKAIPYVIKPQEITPGVPNYYATTYFDGFDFANILVKTREGRPIKIEPNREAGGTTNARVQASVLSLYDRGRLQNPKFKGEDITWDKVDAEVPQKIKNVLASGKEVVFMHGTCASPSTRRLVEQFKEKVGPLREVVYDAVPESAALDAFAQMYGVRELPDYDFSKAKVIVSIGADFLGDWQGGGFEKSYSESRKPESGDMSYHVQLESNLSLTGANADKRVALKPSEQIAALITLFNKVTGNNAKTQQTPVDDVIAALAKRLKAAGSQAVVVTGIQDKNAQLLALAINKALGSQVIDTAGTRKLRQGNNADMKAMMADMKAGKIGGIIIYNANPVYTCPHGDVFAEEVAKLRLSVAFAEHYNETAEHCQYALAVPHYLESWGDVAHKRGHYSMIQPVIRPLFNSRQFQDTLLKWSGENQTYYDYLKSSFNGDFNQAIHDGFVAGKAPEANPASSVDLVAAIDALNKSIVSADLELCLYTKTSMGDGTMANNPWLQELPDPITRATWDNYLTLSPADAAEKGIKNVTRDNGALDGHMVDITLDGVTIENVPVYIQPGQAKGSVGLALGYGRTAGVRDEMKTGVNAFKFKGKTGAVTLSAPKGMHEFACIQLHHTLAGRHDILKEVSLEDYKHGDPHDWNHKHQFSLNHEEVDKDKARLWKVHDHSNGHHFNLSIDLTTCTGCAACVIACHAENNVPVVGKREMRVSRDMHWLRIDRYYSSEVPSREAAKEEGLGRVEMYHGLERVAENPQVAFQPVMCQHCNNAPCETVCPVAATSHSSQGQNNMAYNRCVGTRYCANNCPYRVRRFNWFRYNENSEFDYYMNDEYGKMVLNPDVTVRSRGVMEKCSLCIQMTQATILEAKREGRPVRDGEFSTACVNACATGAMVFGDINDKSSKVAALAEDKRAYHLLDFIGTRPNVVYQVKVRNEA